MRLLSMLSAAIVLAALCAQAYPCDLPAIGSGRVVSVVDGRTLRLDDEREIRLIGVELPPAADDRQRTTAMLATLALGATITLRAETDAPDRYGRQHAMALDDAGSSLQAQLLSRGMALASPLAPASCAAALRAAEAEAREMHSGIWASRTAIKNTERPGDILAAIGQFAVVEGRVRSVREAGGLTYVNFGRRWIEDFALIAGKPAVSAFTDAKTPLKSLENRLVRTRGWIAQRTGPRIEIFRVEQIELLGDNESRLGIERGHRRSTSQKTPE